MPLQDANPTPSFGGFGLKPPAISSLDAREFREAKWLSFGKAKDLVTDRSNLSALNIVESGRIHRDFGFRSIRATEGYYSVGGASGMLIGRMQ